MEILKIISVYTREQALEDGVLEDVTELAKELGFKHPVAIQSRAMAIIKEIPTETTTQDENGRLWDVLFMARVLLKRGVGNTGKFSVLLPHYENDGIRKTIKNKAVFKIVIGPGDNLEPVITIMLPNED